MAPPAAVLPPMGLPPPPPTDPSFGSSTLQLSSEHAMKAPKPSVDQVKTKDM
jgi:hypothetical protein